MKNGEKYDCWYNYANNWRQAISFRSAVKGATPPQEETADLDERWVPAGLSIGQNDLVKILPTPDCYFSTPIICDGSLHQSLNQQRLLDDPILQGKNLDLLW